MSDEHSISDLLPLLELDEYIALDLETTGLNPQTDFITEISACRFINGEFKNEFTSLINPGIPIPKNIVEITGITDAMVSGAPQINEVLPELIEFLAQSPLVGQNVNFDYSFIPYISKNTKKYLKRISAKYFGRSFSYRAKSGFSFPLKKILKSNHFREPIEEEIIPQIKANNLYAFKNIIRIWKNVDKSSSSELELLFSIIAFEIWLKKFKVNV